MIRWSAFLLIFFMATYVISAKADIIVQTSGTPDEAWTLGGSTDDILMGSWSMTDTYSDVTITAEVGEFSEFDPPITAYLTTQVGPGTTNTDEIAETTINVTTGDETDTLFSGLTLGPGTYYLTLTGPLGTYQYWEGTSTPTITTAPDATLFTDAYASSTASYAPASTFTSNDMGLIYSVSTVPEPSTWLLLGSGLLGLAGIALRRKRLGQRG